MVLATLPNVVAQESTPELESRPAQVSVVPGIGTNGLNGSAYRQPFSFNLLGGSNGGVNGFELGGILNIDRAFATGLQIGGLANIVQGPVRGLQIGGVVNTAASELIGLQIGGVANLVKGSVSGLQLGGVVNAASESVDGAQISGVVNIAQQVDGLQLGVVNLAGTAKGLQLGVVNIADSAGEMIGVLNIARKNGYYRGELWAGETFYGNAAFKMGTKKFYTIFALGWQQRDEVYRLGYGLGFGAALGRVAGVDLNLDLLNYQVSEERMWMSNSTNLMQQARLVATIGIGGRKAVLIGTTFNVFESDFKNSGEGTGMDLAAKTIYSKIHRDTRVTMWPGLNAGFRF